MFIGKLKRFFSRSKITLPELNFIKSNIDQKTSTHTTFVVQAMDDYYYLSFVDISLKKGNFNSEAVSLGIWPHCILPIGIGKSRFLRLIKYGFLSFENYLMRKKWAKLYKSAGVKSVVPIGTYFCTHLLQDVLNTVRAVRKLKSKEELIRFEIDGHVFGDLIYDTYLRFNMKPTVDLKDPYLYYLIFKTFNVYNETKNYFLKNSISAYFTSYSSYIQHGVPVRVALSLGINCYSGSNHLQYVKKLSLTNWLHVTSHELYSQKFKELSNQEELIALAKIELEKRFEGKVDAATKYMKKSSFSDSGKLSNDILKSFDGVLFLHDFFDNPHCYRKMVFNDFWEWAIATLNLIREHNLKIAIKGHPNQREESISVLKKLQQMYPDLEWLDPMISNKEIFKSGIKFGVSLHGTVLYELAYHGIVPIGAGDHPAISYDFTFTAKSVSQYQDFILNYSVLKLPENTQRNVLEFYYMHAMNEVDDLPTKAREFGLRSIDFSHPESLSDYLKLRDNDKV